MLSKLLQKFRIIFHVWSKNYITLFFKWYGGISCIPNFIKIGVVISLQWFSIDTYRHTKIFYPSKLLIWGLIALKNVGPYQLFLYAIRI